MRRRAGRDAIQGPPEIMDSELIDAEFLQIAGKILDGRFRIQRLALRARENKFPPL